MRVIRVAGAAVLAALCGMSPSAWGSTPSPGASAQLRIPLHFSPAQLRFAAAVPGGECALPADLLFDQEPGVPRLAVA